jgi:hypothetical protein
LTEFYESQLAREAETLNNSIALLERSTALDQSRSVLIKRSQQMNGYDPSVMTKRCTGISVKLIVHSYTTYPFLLDKAMPMILLKRKRKKYIIRQFLQNKMSNSNYGVL